MRSPIRLAVAAVMLCAALPVAAHAQQAPKIAYVDVAVLMDQAPGRTEAQSQFEKEAGAIRAELQRMSDSLDAAVQAYQKSQTSLTAAQKTAREKDLQDKQAGFQQRAQALQQRGQAREQELVGGFEKLVRDAIDDVRTGEGYAMIFASGQNSALLSADKALDITDKVLARMRTIAAARPAIGAAPSGTTGAPTAKPAGAVPAPAGAARPKVPGTN
jgi:outer membrane protein